MTAGDIVVFLEDPLLFGELLIIGCEPDGRLLCEQVHFEDDSDGAVPVRAVLEPHEVEFFDRWARAA